MQKTPAVTVATRLAELAARAPAELPALSLAGQHFEGGRTSESFDRRQPEHVILASMIGLGLFDASRIEHRKVNLPA